MALDAFLKIDGIPSESADEKHKDWIEVLSFSHGLSQAASASASAGGGRGAERCNHQDFSIVKVLDKASPKLALFCCNGKQIKQVTLELCRATGNKQKYMEYKLSDVVVSSVRPSGAGLGSESLPTEDVSFNYGKIEWTYSGTDLKSGKSKGDITANWDLTTNTGG